MHSVTDERLDARRTLAALGGEPCCPRCGSTDGSLGTQKAYFNCNECFRRNNMKGYQSQYWCCDKFGAGCDCRWDQKVDASPWGDRS